MDESEEIIALSKIAKVIVEINKLEMPAPCKLALVCSVLKSLADDIRYKTSGERVVPLRTFDDILN